MSSRGEDTTVRGLESRTASRADNASRAGSAEELEWLLRPIKDVAAAFEVDLESTWRIILQNLAASEELGGGDASALPNASALDGGMNLGTAALYLQSSAALFSKKVDYVHSQAHQVLSFIAGGKGEDGAAGPKVRKARGPREPSVLLEEEEETAGADGDADDEDQPLRPKRSHFPLAGLEAEAAPREESLFTSRMPMSLLPLEDFEKMNIPIQPKGRSELIGKRDDFAMNGCEVDPTTATLLLDIANQPLIHAAHLPQSESQEDFMMHMDDDGGDEEDMGVQAGRPSTQETEVGRAGEASRAAADRVSGAPSALKASTQLAPPSRSSARLSEMARLAEEPEDGGGDDSLDSLQDDEEEELDPWTEPAPASGGRVQRPRKGRHHRLPAQHWRLLAKKRTRAEAEAGVDSSPLEDADEALCPLSDFLFPSRRQEAKIPANYAPYVPPALEELLYKELKRRRKGRGLGALQRKRAQERGEREAREARAEAREEADEADGPEEEVDISLEGGWGEEEGGGGLADDDFLAAGPERALGSLGYEQLVEVHCLKYFEGARKGLAVSELTKRVEAWESRIKPLLAAEEERPEFRIHVYGGHLLERFEAIGDQKAFAGLAAGLHRWEIPRYFLSSLIMANTHNFRLSDPPRQEENRDPLRAKDATDPLHLSRRVGTLALKLHSTRSHLKEIQEASGF